MPETPARKRAGAASDTVAKSTRRSTSNKVAAGRPARAATLLLEPDEPVQNYALPLTQDLDPDDELLPPMRPSARAYTARKAPRAHKDQPAPDNFELKLTEALAAIASAQERVEAATQPAPEPHVPRNPRGPFEAWLKVLDALPPIKLPIGPAIPWRIGLPVLVAVIALAVASRSSAGVRADTPGVKLPAQETYAVQQDAPLFANSQAAQPAQAPQPVPTLPVQRIGVQEPAGPGFDFFDLGLKLAAVVALAYGSLVLLKRTGLSGAAAIRSSGSAHGLRVISTLALAPNRSVHVLEVPGGKTLLVGATPSAVNFIADLGTSSPG